MALLIGNEGYAKKVGPLNNPHNDVDLVAAALTKVGFKVTVLEDAGYKATTRWPQRRREYRCSPEGNQRSRA
jgi:uncharacterized caspase-like protein